MSFRDFSARQTAQHQHNLSSDISGNGGGSSSSYNYPSSGAGAGHNNYNPSATFGSSRPPYNQYAPNQQYQQAPSSNINSTTSSSTTLEQNLRSVIERIQAESRLAEEELRSHRPSVETLQSFLETSAGLESDGKSLLRDWQVELAGGTDRRRRLL